MMDPTQLYTPEYLAENKSQQLLHVAIIFGVLETVFIFLFFLARIVNKTANGPEMWLMPVAYLACLSHVILIPSWWTLPPLPDQSSSSKN